MVDEVPRHQDASSTSNALTLTPLSRQASGNVTTISPAVEKPSSGPSHVFSNGPEHYTSCVDDYVFEIYPLGKHPTTIGTRIGFSVDDVDSIVPRLVNIGAVVISPPADSQWGRRAVVKDLDGHIVELLTPPNRDVVISSETTSTGVITKTHQDGKNAGDANRH